MEEEFEAENDDVMTTTTAAMATMKMMMKNWISTTDQPDLDAAYILIQLSADSSLSPAHTSSIEESVGDSTTSTTGAPTAAAMCGRGDNHRHTDRDRLSSSSCGGGSEEEAVFAAVDGCGEIEVYPLRKKRRFRSVTELYAITKKSRTVHEFQDQRITSF